MDEQTPGPVVACPGVPPQARGLSGALETNRPTAVLRQRLSAVVR